MTPAYDASTIDGCAYGEAIGPDRSKTGPQCPRPAGR